MEWISVKDRLPKTKQLVLVCIEDNNRQWITIAEYIAPRSINAEDYEWDDTFLDDDFVDYDEENDIYFVPEGFYEWGYENEIKYRLSAKVTHWMPLPKYPKSA